MPRKSPSRKRALGKDCAARPLNGIRIFVVDDEPLQVELVSELLEDAGAHVRGTTDPVVMEQMLWEQKPDVLVADVFMPGLDGWELFARMRAIPHHRETPVIFMTFLAEPEAAHHFTQGDGRCRVLSKPFQRAELISSVQELVRGSV